MTYACKYKHTYMGVIISLTFVIQKERIEIMHGKVTMIMLISQLKSPGYITKFSKVHHGLTTTN